LNYQLFSKQAEKHEGAFASEHSFLQVQPENVVLTAVKKAEDDDTLILRFYEWAGKETDVKLQLPTGAQTASETDLMERVTGTLSIQDGAITIHTKPYEIKTVKVQFAAKSSPMPSPVTRTW
jgi:alpha-mannosidase